MHDISIGMSDSEPCAYALIVIDFCDIKICTHLCMKLAETRIYSSFRISNKVVTLSFKYGKFEIILSESLRSIRFIYCYKFLHILIDSSLIIYYQLDRRHLAKLGRRRIKLSLDERIDNSNLPFLHQCEFYNP